MHEINMDWLLIEKGGATLKSKSVTNKNDRRLSKELNKKYLLYCD